MKRLKTLIPFALFLIYGLLVCVSGTIGHNHDIDGSFHDNCPACQWQVQFQQDDTSTSTALDALIDPLVFVGRIFTVQSIILNKQEFQTSNLSRAPPQFS